MIPHIEKQIEIIDRALNWAKEFNRPSFPVEQLKKYRRDLRKIRRALEKNCAAAAYGESQVGKSYLMSSLLSTPDTPFVISDGEKEYSFINDLNESGDRNSQVETTGVITRFTIKKDGIRHEGKIKVVNLSVTDIILLLTDSYYNDINIDTETMLSSSEINEKLDGIKRIANEGETQEIITEDDVREIYDYIHDIIRGKAAPLLQSNFFKVIAPLIAKIPPKNWVDVFGLLWNQNHELNRLFTTLIEAYKKIGFSQEILVPFKAITKKDGTLLKVSWLDSVCGVQIDTGTDNLYTDVYSSQGELLATNFNKSELSALIAEVCMELPYSLSNQRRFLKEMDLLDFPGARSREQYKEADIATVLSKMLRRGKVAYLFNKYSRALQINSVLFCHHNDQKSEPTIGETINTWIETTIGTEPEERTKNLKNTNWIAPLFFIATKFNKDIQKTWHDGPSDLSTLDQHWERFDTVIPEIVKPDKWMDEWCKSENGEILPFQNIYPLRDFHYSSKEGIFAGYNDKGSNKTPEKELIRPSDFPEYYEKLKESFIANPFVKKHFSNPSVAWDSVATLNNDGSKTIIKNLNAISEVLNSARIQKYRSDLEKIKSEILGILNVHYEPEDLESKNKKVRAIAGDIRRSLITSVASEPSKFGHLIDALMIPSKLLRNVAYDIIVLHTERPIDFNYVNFNRALAGIDLRDSREENIQRLLDYYVLDTEEKLGEHLAEKGYTIEDFLNSEAKIATTLGDVIANNIEKAWIDYLNSKIPSLVDILPHMEEVVHMLVNLFEKLKIKKEMASTISRYLEIFSKNEQPNAIGDYSSLLLNKFVSNTGISYIPKSELISIAEKAQICRIPIETANVHAITNVEPTSIEDTLKIFDDATSIINAGNVDMELLRKLPFWNNFQQWENSLMIGLIVSSDISKCDPVANERIRKMIDESNNLFQK